VSVSGIVVACRPEHLDGVAERLNALAWAEVHYTDSRGRLVVTIEAADTDESRARLEQIQALPRVLMAELAEYHLEEEKQQGPRRAGPSLTDPDGNKPRRAATRRREE
jgi:nitrate reductase NapAB chaperone NapD